MEIVEITPRRVYIKTRYGEPVVEKLKDLGAHWDPSTKMWWVGKRLLHKVHDLCKDEVNAQTTKNNKIDTEQLKRDREAILGTAEYKGRTYFFVKEGVSTRGPYVRLMFRDGSKTFFADASAVKIKKRFARPTPLSLISEGKPNHTHRHTEQDAEQIFLQPEEWKICWECGRQFTRRDAQRRGGDWFDSYCGC